MLGILISQIGLIALAATWLLAWTKGGPAERFAANVVGVAWIGSMAVSTLASPDGRELVLLGFDFLLALGLLLIAIAYSSRWLGAAMLLQALVLALHADMVTDMTHRARHFVVLLNVASFSMLFAIVGASGATWIKRALARRGQSAAEVTTAPGARTA